MANPHKGEVSFEAKGQTYVLKMGTYARAVLERRVKMPIGKFIKRDPDEWGVDDMLSMFYSGLFQKYKLTEEQVAELMDEIGEEKVTELILEALGVANAKEVAKGTESPTPAKADGIGMH